MPQHTASSRASLTGYRRIVYGEGYYFPLIVVDDRGLPVAAPTEWYRLRREWRRPPGTTKSYLPHILAFLWFCHERGLRWNDQPRAVREAFIAFLRHRLHCRVEPDALAGVRYSPTRDTPLSPSTLNVLRSAVTDFYTVMRAPEVGLYRHDHPFTSVVLQRLNQVRREALARGELDAGSGAARRAPSAFVRARRAHEWTPDPELAAPQVVASIFAVVDAVVHDARIGLRDRAILALLRLTGARVGEVVALPVGGYRRPGRAGRLRVTSKGEQGRLTKTLYFDAAPHLQRLLHRYAEEERPCWDPQGRQRLADVGDGEPFFLTRRGTAYTYAAFEANWRKHARPHRSLCPVAFSLHDVRHAFVTHYLLNLRAEQQRQGYDEAWRLEQRAVFARDIMGWHDAHTIEVYDHSLSVLDALGRLATAQQGGSGPPAASDDHTGPGRADLSVVHTVPGDPRSPYPAATLARIARYSRAPQEEEPR